MMPVVHVLLVLALFGAGLVVRMAGDAAVLNFVSYARITDRTQLHRWAGTRLLILSCASAVLAGFAWIRQDLAIVLLFVQFTVVFLAAVAIAAGASKFTKSLASSRMGPTL